MYVHPWISFAFSYEFGFKVAQKNFKNSKIFENAN